MPSRNILITGVSRGLGRAMTSGFIQAGHVVWGCARDQVALDELSRRWPSPHHFVKVDTSRDADIAHWAAEATRQSFVPDLLINNAALVNKNARLWEVSADEFDRLLAVNISGVANVIRHFVPAMIRRGRGVIVNFGWGRSLSMEMAPYCATTSAIEGLTQVLAAELPKGMAAVPLNPGSVDTDMLRSCFGDDAADFPSADDWAQRAVPVLLNLCPKDNGQPLRVPGRAIAPC